MSEVELTRPRVVDLAVVCIRTEMGHHAGLLHRVEGGARILHLAWHHILCSDDLADSSWFPCAWAAVALDSDRAEVVAAACRRVWTRYQTVGLPYALKFVDQRFAISTGELVLGPEGAGLTCATFVLAMFRTASIQLLAEAEWEDRAGDREWQSSIVTRLRDGGRATAAHIERLESEVGCTRFRPEDVVAGAAAAPKLPLSFVEAHQHGTEIVARLAQPTPQLAGNAGAE
jgi:hypothetical protein